MTLLLERKRKYFVGVERKRNSQESSRGTLKGGWRAKLKISQMMKSAMQLKRLN